MTERLKVTLSGHGKRGTIRPGDVIVSITHETEDRGSDKPRWDCHGFDGLTVVDSEEGFGGQGLTCVRQGRGKTRRSVFGTGWVIVVDRGD